MRIFDDCCLVDRNYRENGLTCQRDIDFLDIGFIIGGCRGISADMENSCFRMAMVVPATDGNRNLHAQTFEKWLRRGSEIFFASEWVIYKSYSSQGVKLNHETAKNI